MKFILLLIVALSAAFGAQAKCYTHRITCWPLGKTIKQNSVFVLEGYADSQALIKGLGTTYTAYLTTGTQLLPLEVREILVGEYQLTQAVLRPRRKLDAGKQYELIIRKAGEKEKFLSNVLFTHADRRFAYTVVAGEDKAAPDWQLAPQEKSKSYEELGCGPEVAVEFYGKAQDQSPYLVKATVKNLATGKATSYYLQPTAQSIISVGHGMCAGAFALEKGKNFSVAFALLDASGNTTNRTSNALLFTAPASPG